jgi:hypothetical protein
MPSADAAYDAKVAAAQAAADAAAAAKATADAKAAADAAEAARIAALPKVSSTFQNPDGTTTIVMSDGSTKIAGVPTVFSWTNPTTGLQETFANQMQLDSAKVSAQIKADATNTQATILANQQSQLATQQYNTQMYNTQNDYANSLARQSAFDVLMTEFNKFGLGSLVEPLSGMLKQNVSPAQFSIELRNTQAYKDRFSANDTRIKNGLRALGPAEYLANEDAYRQTLRAYGLTAFDNDAYVKKFLENDMSPAELNTRVVDAVQRIQLADPSIKATIQQYYGLSDTELTAYILDPKNQLPAIERKIQAGEIGGAALNQGLNVNSTTAEDLAAYGVTQNQARQGYQTISDILPTADKLSNIYGSTMDKYGQTQAEQEVFKGTASAKRARERLVGRETAQFQGQSGMQRNTLEQGSSKGNY